MAETERPVVLNPEAIGDPDQTPVVQLPPAMVAMFERTRCPECRCINHFHDDDCSVTPPAPESATDPSACVEGEAL